MLQRVALAVLLVNPCLMQLRDLAAAEQVTADQADEDFRLAAEMYRRQKWQAAAETFSRFLGDHPEHSKVPVAQLYLGLSQHNMEDYRSARSSLETYLRRFSDHSGAADARFRIGECSFYLGELDRAQNELETYLAGHDTHDMTGWANLLIGDILVAREDWQSAAEHWQSMLNTNADPKLIPDVRYGLARSLEGLGKLREAFSTYRELSDGANDQLASRSLARMGHIYFESKDFPAAARAYRAIAARFPQSPDVSSARMNAGLALFQDSQYSAALEQLSEAIKDRQYAFRGGLLAARCHQSLNDIEAARTTYHSTLEAAGDNASAARVMFEWAQMERASNHQAAAIQIFRDLADRYPNSADAVESLMHAADLLMDAEQPDDAARLLARLRAELDTNAKGLEPAFAAEVDTLEGRIQLALGMPDAAIGHLRAALASGDLSESHAAVARYHLVRALHQTTRVNEAIAEAEPLLERIRTGEQTDLAQIFVIAADSYLINQDDKAAENLAREYLSLTKDSPGTATRLDAWATRFKAAAIQNQFDATLAMLPEFRDEFESNDRYARILLASGENAWKQDQPDVSARLFEQIVALPETTPERPQALSGVAWSEFDSGRIAESVDATVRFISEYPNDSRVAEMSYLRGLGQAKLLQFLDAAKTLESLFDSVIATREIMPGDESTAPTKYAFEGGRLAARFYETAEQLDDADRMWEKLTTQFRTAESTDELLYEWAGRNAALERFEEADGVYRMLLDRYPGSRFADAASLALAESDWIAGRPEQARLTFAKLAENEQSAADIREKAMFHLITMLAESEAWAESGQLASKYLSLFENTERKHAVRLFLARAHLEAGELEDADSLVRGMMDEALNGTIADAPWTDEIWIVAAETALARKEYDRIDSLENQLAERHSDSAVMYKMKRVQGRRWKSQAPPDFEKAREALRLVTTDIHGRGTEDAARAQFLIAETFLLQDNPQDAFREYYRVHVNYQFPEMQAMALYQAGGCEQAIRDYQSAIQTYTELIDTFAEAPDDLRANAILRMAECSVALRKLDDARNYYERVRNEFRGSPQATAATAQLKALAN